MKGIEALYVLTWRVDDFAGWGAATIQWLRTERSDPLAPYPELIGDYRQTTPEVRGQAERAVRALFTRDEASALCLYFADVYPEQVERLQLGALRLPLFADELIALVAAEPDPDASRCLVRLPAQGPPPPVPIVGVAAPWPWPDLEPANVARLIEVRERLGMDPVPPVPSRARPKRVSR